MDSKMIIKQKGLPKPLLLKDYLLDDMSSCSSNGFKSFPRRKFCTSTVRFLIEMDIKNKQQYMKTKQVFKNSNKSPPTLLKNPSKSAIAAFQSVIAAIRRLPFTAASSPEKKKKKKKSILPRNFSKKLLKKSSFWKRKSSRREIERLPSFDQLLKELPEASDVSATATTTSDDGKSKSWSGSDFTAPDDCNSSGNSSSEVNLDLPQDDVIRNGAVEVVKDGDVSTDSTVIGSDSINSSSTEQKQWSVNEEKQQLSPVSILDCPFDDDDDEVSSPFQHKLQRIEGTQKKLMEKIQKFGCLAQLEPVNLTKRFVSLNQDSDNESTVSLLNQYSPASSNEKVISDTDDQDQENDDEENQAEHKALDLLHQLKINLPSYGLLKVKADRLLLDFFREKIVDQNVQAQKQWCGDLFCEALLEDAKNWINGTCELFLGWEVPRNGQAYMVDMEKEGVWKSLDEKNQQVALELEAVVFADLLDELCC